MVGWHSYNKVFMCCSHLNLEVLHTHDDCANGALRLKAPLAAVNIAHLILLSNIKSSCQTFCVCCIVGNVDFRF